MVRKCSVGGCKSNYDTEIEYVEVHGFPSDEDGKQCWINVLPNVLEKITGLQITKLMSRFTLGQSFLRQNHFYVKFQLLHKMLKTVMLMLLHDDRLMNREIKQPTFGNCL